MTIVVNMLSALYSAKLANESGQGTHIVIQQLKFMQKISAWNYLHSPTHFLQTSNPIAWVKEKLDAKAIKCIIHNYCY